MYLHGGAVVAGEGRREDSLHLPRIAMGEWILREHQRVAARGTAQWRDILLARRGPHPDRSLAATLQHRPAAQLARVSTTCAGGRSIASGALRFRFAPPTANTGDGGANELTIHPDRKSTRLNSSH